MYDIELVNAALKLLRDMFGVQKGESVVITADTESNYDVVEATAQAAFILGGRPIITKIASPRGVGKAADPDLPMEPLIGLLSAADVWVEYNNQWLFYSTVYDKVVATNKKLRYMNLVGANPDLFMRNIGRVDIPLLTEFILKVEEVTKKAKHIRVTTPAGTDVEFDNFPGREFLTADGVVRKGEVKMLPGQIAWSPDFKTINGIIVIDGALTPPLGKLTEPVKLTVKEGRIVKVEGGKEAKEFENWLNSFNDENMFITAHISYGLGPGAKLTGDIVEDERVWGCTEWGFGNVGAILVSDIPGGIPAASHSDGICLNSTVYLDGKLFLKEGQVVGPTEEIVNLAKKLGK
ncbi:MAG: aminopeptidase [Firmicutes bacterium]|jgi:leucyl aminopeptidase (aminopeptidase T)|nr:aminopeptidase [Bacillota bacterium]